MIPPMAELLGYLSSSSEVSTLPSAIRKRICCLALICGGSISLYVSIQPTSASSNLTAQLLYVGNQLGNPMDSAKVTAQLSAIL